MMYLFAVPAMCGISLLLTASTFVYLQKWSKGKVRDKLNNLVLFDKATYDKLYKEVPSYKLITPSVVSERLKVRGSLARAALIELHSKGMYTGAASNGVLRGKKVLLSLILGTCKAELVL